MNKKIYQVFVSSTYEDLLAERQCVMHALLELDCIPTGMELFPAADEEQWGVIKRVIDESDYFILIMGGRYGSLGPNGIGYTEMEYQYALSIKKPIISFLYKDPGQLPVVKTDQNVKKSHKLSEFRKLVQRKMCKYWSDFHELGAVVSRSVVALKQNSPASGWVRASHSIGENQILQDERSKFCVLIYEPGESSSLGLRHHSAEHWVVCSGTLRVTKGDDEFILTENEATYIPLGTKYQVRNIGKVAVEMIVIRRGDYLGDDDFIEF